METLEKQKLLAWLKILAELNSLSQAYYAIEATIQEINHGTFDYSEGEMMKLQEVIADQKKKIKWYQEREALWQNEINEMIDKLP